MASNMQTNYHPPVAPRVGPLSEGVVQGSSPWQVDHRQWGEEAEVVKFLATLSTAITETARAYGMSAVMSGLYATAVAYQHRLIGDCSHWGDGESVIGPIDYLTIQIRITPKLLEWARQ